MRHTAFSRILAAVVALLSAEITVFAVLGGERYALVVGVHQYDKNQLRSLPYAETDAIAVAERLKAIGFRRVVLMTQSLGAKEARFLPTAANLRESIQGFLDPRKWEEDDTAVIVLSGHGVQFRGQDASYFCPMDARLEKRETLIDVQEIYRNLEKCPAGFKLLIADCCRNDPQSDFSRARAEVDLESVTRPQRAKPPGGVAAFYSCSAGEKAFESAELKRGVFTHFLLEALSNAKADLDRDGKVDLDELARFTKRNVTDYVSDQFGESTVQVPELVGRTRGIVPLFELAKIPDRPVEPLPPLTPPKAGNGLKTITSKATGMKLVLIPAGEYDRGSPDLVYYSLSDERPRHRVRIGRDFYIGQFEVTQAEWTAVMGTEPWKDQSDVRTGKDYPACHVTWDDAREFCRKLSEREGRTFRLPTEAEWEYACRAGTATLFHFGDDEKKIGEFAWFGDNAFRADENYAHAVGQKAPNPYGLFDMYGNMWEWCSDYYDTRTYEAYAGRTAEDPQGPKEGEFRVMRGGSWMVSAMSARSASRVRDMANSRRRDVGFRVVAESSAK